MSYNNVDKSTGNLIPVAGATLYADLPIGSWIKNDMSSIPAGFLKEGDTISQSEYPELYAKYGSTVPYKADTSELSEWVTSDFANNTDKTMPYDGVGMISNGNDTEVTITVNGVVIGRDSGRSTYSSSSMFFQFKKNDVIKFSIQNGNIANQKVAYYKKSLIVKAKSTGAPTDIIEAVKDAIFPTAPTTPTSVYSNLNSSSNIDYTYTVTERAFYLVRLHCYSEQESHSWQLYLNNIQIGSESSYASTSGVGATMTLPCNVGDTIRVVVSCGGSGTYDKRNAAIYKL